MLDLTIEVLSEARTASRSVITAEFLEPLEGEPVYTSQHAAEAWELLVQQDIVTLDDDVVALHPRFAHLRPWVVTSRYGGRPAWNRDGSA